MSEVDYSDFYYRKNHQDKELNDSFTPPEPEDKGKKRRAKKKIVGKIFTTLTVLLLLFAISLLVVDFFLNGSVLTKVFSVFRGSDYEYYFVVTEKTKRDYAYAQSLQVKVGGGAGYIITEEERFYVAYGVFCSRPVADEISAKNANTYVKIIGFSSKNVDFCNLVDGYLRQLTDLIVRYEKGEWTESDASIICRTVASDAKQKKEDLEKTLSDVEKNLLDYISATFGGADFSTGTRAEFLSDLRYAVCSVAYSFCRVE